MAHYIGIIHKEPDSEYGVSFPDFPGCISAGRTLDDARAMAEEALDFHVAGLIEDGEPLPAPSLLETVMANPDFRDGVAILVPLRARPPKSVRVNVMLPADVLERVDRFAEAHGYTRSGFLARAAQRAMDEEPV